MMTRRHLLAGLGAALGAAVLPAAVVPAYGAPVTALTGPPRNSEPVAEIIAIAARHAGLQPADILGPLRTKLVVETRQRAMFVAWAATGKSLPEIGRRFGNRDHTTVLHALRKRAAVMRHDVLEWFAIHSLARQAESRTGISIDINSTVRRRHEILATPKNTLEILGIDEATWAAW